jgi:protein involved in polysaccharide export with SLBB domain
MTLLRLRPAARWAALVLSSLVVVGAARAAEEPDTEGRTFNVPGYTPPASTSSERPATGGANPSEANEGAANMRGTPSRNMNTREASSSNNRGRASGTAADGTRTGDTPANVSARARPRAPEPPSAFQRFVETSTGRLLPIFGSRFFQEAADGFAAVDNVPVSADYTVGPGDEVLVRAWGSIDVDFRTTVDRNGQISLPKVGSFTVAGVKAADLERHLRAQIGRLYTNFSLNVTLGQLRGVKVFVVGPARTPGVYTLSSQSTLLSAVVAAGGPAGHGSMRKVLLRRDGRVISELDIYDFLVAGDKSRDLQLAAGDVVVFQPAGARVALSGALDTSAVYELKGREESVAEVLRYAGGAPLLADPHRLHLERVDTSQIGAPRRVEKFKLDDAGRAKMLRDGDLLTLLPISQQFANEVTLKGHVAHALRYPFTAGMRIRDLIPDKDALITADFYRRKNMLVRPGASRDSQRTTADRPASDARSANWENDAELAAAMEERTAIERAKKAPAALFEEINWDYAVVERLNPADLSTQVIPFNLGKAVLLGDAAHNIELQAGDVVTVYSQKDVRVPVARQTRLVSLEGEVGAPGVYQLLPGETLQQLIVRAGGFTPQAYVFGLELTREETRIKQQQNLESAIARLEAAAATQNARDVANQRDAASSQINASSTNAQLARLKRLTPNGRIALELSPDVYRPEELPDLPLENQDRIVVPPRPGFVTVAGAVVNSNSFIWKPGRTAGDYIQIAGLDETADKSGIFILRADGTVDHASSRGFLGFGNVTSQKLNPGDAIVVPSQVDFESWGRAFVRNLKDWSQIFYQFGLGAAAIETLRKN